MEKARQGVFIAFMYCFLSATISLIAKYAMTESRGGSALRLDATTYALALFGMGYVYLRLYVRITGQDAAWRAIFAHWRFLAFIALLDGASVFLWLNALRMMNPAVVAFYINSTILFVVIMGVIFLQERFNRVEMIGGIIILVGVPLMLHSTEKGEFLPTLLIMISALMSAVTTIVIKKKMVSINPLMYSVFRALFIFLYVGLYGIGLLLYATFANIGYNHFFTPDWRWILFVVCTSAFLGPFLSMNTFFEALKRLEASKLLLITAFTPLLILLGSVFILKDPWPDAQKIFGGLVVLGGVIALALGKLYLKQPNDIVLPND